VRIEQIVSNIIGNAVKYTPAGGKITVSLSIETDEAVLRVQDDGFGIAPELLWRRAQYQRCRRLPAATRGAAARADC
jgi:signal transduction histidine kinase